MQFNGMKKSPSSDGTELKQQGLKQKRTPIPPPDSATDNEPAFSPAGTTNKSYVPEKKAVTSSSPRPSSSRTPPQNDFHGENVDSDQHKTVKAGSGEKVKAKKQHSSGTAKTSRKSLVPIIAAVVMIAVAVTIVPKGLELVRTKKAENEREANITSILADAEQHAASGDYEHAIAIIEAGMSDFSDSEELKERKKNYNDLVREEKDQKECEDTLAEAANMAAQGKYKEAVSLLDKLVKKFGKESVPEELLASYKAGFAETALAEATSMVERREYPDAIKLINEAIRIAGETEGLRSLKDYVDKYQEKGLGSINPVSGEIKWNDGTPSDPFGHNYSNVRNYCIFSETWRGTVSSEFRLSGKYDTFSFSYTPHKDFEDNSKAYIQVYVDNKLIYTSPLIERKTEPQSVTLDIGYADFLKIVMVNSEKKGIIMITDAVVSSAPDYVPKEKSSLTSLSLLEPINGGFEWNDRFPEDLYGNDYSTVGNYFSFHGTYHESERAISSEFLLSGSYRELSFSVAPCSDFGMNAESYIQVYVDEVLQYTSPIITSKSGIFEVKVDVTGANYVKILVHKGEHGCLLLSNANLLQADTPLSAPDTGIVYLSTLPTMGEEIDWNNKYPKDMQRNDYTYVHDYCYLDHWLTSKYEYNYYLNGQYTGFSMDFAPTDEFGDSSASTVYVFVDDNQIYRMDTVQLSGKTGTGILDVTGKTYLKIVVDHGSGGDLIISNAYLIQ